MKCVSLCVLAAALIGSGAARAQDSDAPKEAMPPFGMPSAASPAAQPKPTTPRPTMFAAASAVNAKRLTVEQREERSFLRDAAAASRYESEAAKMALAKSSNAAVRSFAATLVNHHASAGPVLQHMLHTRGMAVPMLANDQRKTLNRLTKLNGTKFDREFLEEVGLKTQAEDVRMFEKASLVARDPALKGWIDKTAPTLRYHLATAERASNREVRVAKGTTPVVQAGARAHVAKSPAQPAFQPNGATLFATPPLATQFMGAGPAFQMGVTQPIAARPNESRTTESNIR